MRVYNCIYVQQINVSYPSVVTRIYIFQNNFPDVIMAQRQF